jgi:hypothetical protein
MGDMTENPWRMSLKELMVIFAIIAVWLAIFFGAF